MFVFIATKNKLIARHKETVTSGSSNVYKAEFMFDGAWHGLKRTAVFKAGSKSVSVLLTHCNVCTVPWEVLEKDGIDLYVGVYGTKNGTVILPTTWYNAGTILKGTTLGDDPVPPTPGLYEQILDHMQDIADTTLKEARKSADDAETYSKSAKEAKSYIENMTVSSETLSPGSEATVQKTITEDSLDIHFGIPAGDGENMIEIGKRDIFNIWNSEILP